MEGDSSKDAAANAASPGKEPVELKAGHAPATKVGGMRVVQHKQDKPEPPKMTAEEKEEFGEDKPEKRPSSAIVSGAPVGEEAAFPPGAVKAFHEKPMPKHDNKAGAQKPKIIQQPQK